MRGAGDCVTANNHRPREAGTTGRRRPPCPSALPRERARPQPTPRASTFPRPFPAEALALVVMLALPHAWVGSGNDQLAQVAHGPNSR